MPHGPSEGVDAPSRAADRRRAVGGYRLVDRLSTGVVADVWRAVPENDRVQGHPVDGDVVVKWSGPDPTDEARRRLRAEADLLRAVRHPGLVELVDVVDSEEDGTAVVTRFVEGTTLAERIADGALAPVDVVAIGVDLGAALVELHDRGRVHGDVCPANVVVRPDGSPVLVDVGVGASRVVEGTPGYVAPEVEAGAVPTVAADVHGLGLTLVAALVGRDPPPIDVETAIASAGVSTDLAAALGGACAERVADRHEDAAELVVALAGCPERTGGGDPPAGLRPPGGALAVRAGGRTRPFGEPVADRPRRGVVLAGAVVVLAVVALALWAGAPGPECRSAAVASAGRPVASGRAWIDVDDDGCAEQVAWTSTADGIVVTVGDEPGSLIAGAVAAVPGDLDCDGVADHLRTTTRRAGNPAPLCVPTSATSP